MGHIGTESTGHNEKNVAMKETSGTTAGDAAASLRRNFFAKQYSANECGIPTDIYCLACGEKIYGSFLPTFKCPHCEILICRDDSGNITNFEQRHTCPECGHRFSKMADKALTEFRRRCVNFEEKTEEVFLEFDRILNRLFP